MIKFESSSENIYVVLSQTGTLISKWLKFFTKEEYNHVSISLDEKLNEMCSFARYYTYFPFYGGLVRESMDKGVLKRYKNTKGIVIKFHATKEKVDKIKNTLNEMFENQKKYKYDILGVIFAGFGKKKIRKNKYYCTEFCKYILVEHKIVDKSECPEIMHVTDFLNLSSAEIIFEGNLHKYSNKINL